FDLAGTDTTPPRFSYPLQAIGTVDIKATGVTDTTATIQWTTSEGADSRVEYGPTTAYGSSTTLDPAARDLHTVPLANLQRATTYHYRVKSRDLAGNLAVSSDLTLTTQLDTTPPVNSNMRATGV